MLFSATSPLSLAISVTVHEAAHIICAFVMSGQLPFFRLRAGGIGLSYFGLPSVRARLAVSLAGPLANILAAAAFSDHKDFFFYSMSLGAVNLLPVSCLDGGNALAAICDRYFPRGRSEAVCRTVSVIMILVLFAVNCAVQLKYGANISLAVITVVLTVSVLGKY